MGVTPSTETIHEPWANSWIYGLVPPSSVETASKCTSGVAKVETQRTFLNGLVGILTLGIYTPMEIKVTCAMGGSADSESPQADFTIDNEATAAEIGAAFQAAASRAVKERREVYVRF